MNGKVALFVLAMLATLASGPVGAVYGWAWGWVVTALATLYLIWWGIRDHLRRRMARLTGLPVPDEVVKRPEQVDEVVRYLTGRRRGPVGITATTALTGAGGFGKTAT